MRRLAPLLVLFVAACGAATPAAEHPEPAVSTASAPEPLQPPRREGTIEREELETVLAAGLGRFLQGVMTEPHLEQGRFVGFRFTELRASFFASLDLQVGDTLVSVNGLPIERPEQAMTIWNGLRVASEITLEYLRDGERGQLRFAIRDEAPNTAGETLASAP